MFNTFGTTYTAGVMYQSYDQKTGNQITQSKINQEGSQHPEVKTNERQPLSWTC